MKGSLLKGSDSTEYRCPDCGSRELYVATWVRMNPPIGEHMDMIGDVEDESGELLPAWCTECDRDIHDADYLPHEPREGWHRTAKVLICGQPSRKG